MDLTFSGYKKRMDSIMSYMMVKLYEEISKKYESYFSKKTDDRMPTSAGHSVKRSTVSIPDISEISVALRVIWIPALVLMGDQYSSLDIKMVNGGYIEMQIS